MGKNHSPHDQRRRASLSSDRAADRLPELEEKERQEAEERKRSPLLSPLLESATRCYTLENESTNHEARKGNIEIKLVRDEEFLKTFKHDSSC